MRIRGFSSITSSAYEMLLGQGVLFVEPTMTSAEYDKSRGNYQWYYAYKWMSEVLNDKDPDNDITYPIWFWSKLDNTTNILNTSCSHFINKKYDNYLIEVDLDSDKVILSDFHKWHYPLNGWYLPEDLTTTELNDFDRKYYEYGEESFMSRLDPSKLSKLLSTNPHDREARSLVLASWKRCLLEESAIYEVNDIDVQGVTWQFDKSDIVNVYKICVPDHIRTEYYNLDSDENDNNENEWHIQNPISKYVEKVG